MTTPTITQPDAISSEEKQDHHRRRLPGWAILAIGAVACGIGMVWSFGLHDETGNQLIDKDTAPILILFISTVGTLLGFLLQRQNDVKHQVQNSHKTNMRDDLDVVKDSSESAASDTAAIKEDVSDLKEDLGDVKGDLKDLRGELRDSRRETHDRLDTHATDISELRKAYGSEMKQFRQEVGDNVSALRNDVGELAKMFIEYIKKEKNNDSVQP